MDQLSKIDKDALYQFSRAGRAEVVTELSYEVDAVLALLIGFDKLCFTWRLCLLLECFQDSCKKESVHINKL